MPVGIPKQPVKQVSPMRSNARTSFIDARFNTPEEAAAHAGAIFNGTSIADDFEVGGGILQDKEGKYYFTFSLGKRGTGEVSFNIVRPAGHSTVGTWHTHGNEGPAREFFSKKDHAVTEDLGVPAYMTSSNGALVRLSPGQGQPQKFSRPVMQNGRQFNEEATVVPGQPVLDSQGRPFRVRTELGQELFPKQGIPKTNEKELPPPQRAARKRTDAPVSSNDPRRDQRQ
jgi:hypothetical protein